MRATEISKTIQIPDGVDLTLDDKKVTVKGAKGTLTRSFSYTPLAMVLIGKELILSVKWPRKKESSLIGTIYAHIQNMITGVSKGYSYKVKIVFSHFPISVKVKDKTVLIENFTGERNPRKARIIGDVQIKIESEDVTVQGTNLEDVSQTAANMEQATKVRRKDPRIFLDGLFVYELKEGM
jgi:large subunit ribosomal protein L6